MELEIRSEPATRANLAAYAEVSIAFVVHSRFRVEGIDGGLGGLRFSEEAVPDPYVKDYDAEKGEGPARWAERWDLSSWRLFSAFEGGQREGGAIVAGQTAGLNFLGGRDDLAALWDLRVAPERRGEGVGTRLFEAAAALAGQRAARQLKIETQNINVPACRFYAAKGARLGGVHLFAYPELPDEVELDWYLDL